MLLYQILCMHVKKITKSYKSNKFRLYELKWKGKFESPHGSQYILDQIFKIILSISSKNKKQ